MITLSLAPDGAVQAFCEAVSPEDRGYYLDLPQDGDTFMRLIYQALLQRQARINRQPNAQVVDVAAIAKWLENHPPVPRDSKGKVVKATATLDDLADLFGPSKDVELPAF